MMANGIRLNAIGQIERLPQDVQDVLFRPLKPPVIIRGWS